MTRSLGPFAIGPLSAGTVGVRAAAALLGAGCVAWAAAPPAHPGIANLALVLAVGGVAAGALRLALAGVPEPEDSFLLPVPLRAWLGFLLALRQVPWEEGAVIGIVWLEVLHPSRPWHTAVLGAALLAYLLATHLAESGASPGVLRPQAGVLAAGAGLLALGAGAGMLPASGPGAGSALLRLIAAGALIAAAGLVLPQVARPGGHDRGSLRAGQPLSAARGARRASATWPGFAEIGLRPLPAGCRDIQEEQVIPRSSLGPNGLRPGWSRGKMGLYATGPRSGREGRKVRGVGADG